MEFVFQWQLIEAVLTIAGKLDVSDEGALTDGRCTFGDPVVRIVA